MTPLFLGQDHFAELQVCFWKTLCSHPHPGSHLDPRSHSNQIPSKITFPSKPRSNPNKHPLPQSAPGNHFKVAKSYWFPPKPTKCFHWIPPNPIMLSHNPTDQTLVVILWTLKTHIPDICHFFLHGQNFWRIKFTPKNTNFSRYICKKNATFSCKICRKCQFFALNL